MHDLSITIDGTWWDTLLYKGKLHAFTPEGDWEVYDWDGITSELEAKVEEAARPALQFSFRESNAIKKGALSRKEVTESFKRLSTLDFYVSAKELAKHLLTKSDVSAAFPSTSMNMHYDRMVVSSQNGVHAEYVNADSIGDHVLKKLSSIATRQISASYGKVACASGDAGLRQLDLHLEEGFKPIESEGLSLNDESCDGCDWMYQNISAFSYNGGSFLAKFRKTGEYVQPQNNAESYGDEGTSNIERIEFSGNSDLTEGIEEQEADLGHIFSWGAHDKIYRISENYLRAFRFLDSGKRPLLGKVELPGSSHEIVSVKSALFGVIIEFDETIVVIKGDGTRVDIDGEPVNIATFARSRSYENQLHLVMEDQVVVRSFNLEFEAERFREKSFGSKWPNDWFGEEGQ